MPEALNELLHRVTKQQQEIAQARPLPEATLRSLLDDFLLRFAHDTTAIEGNTLTLQETQVVLEHGITIGGKTIREHLEVRNIATAWHALEQWIQSRDPLTETVITHLRQLTMQGILDDAGCYRTVPVFIRGARHVPPNPFRVPDAMARFIAQFAHRPDTLHPIVFAAHAAFILDDTTDRRVGRHLENVSYVFDHVLGKTVLGFKHLVLGFFDGTTFIPLDFSIHAEKRLRDRKRREQYRKICHPGSPGSIPRKECAEDKLTQAIAMVKRAVKQRFQAHYVLADSWFGSKEFIQAIRQIKKGTLHVVCGVRKDKRQYRYHGNNVNAQSLLAILKDAGNAKRCHKLNTRYYEVGALRRDRRGQIVRVPLPVPKTVARVSIHGHHVVLCRHDGDLRYALDD